VDVIYGCGGADGWRSVFNSAMELDDAFNMSSVLNHADGSHAMSLVVNASGGLAGIIIDTDITRRVVAKNLDPSS
jgi:CBS domain-containing protein